MRRASWLWLFFSIIAVAGPLEDALEQLQSPRSSERRAALATLRGLLNDQTASRILKAHGEAFRRRYNTLADKDREAAAWLESYQDFAKRFPKQAAPLFVDMLEIPSFDAIVLGKPFVETFFTLSPDLIEPAWEKLLKSGKRSSILAALHLAQHAPANDFTPWKTVTVQRGLENPEAAVFEAALFVATNDKARTPYENHRIATVAAQWLTGPGNLKRLDVDPLAHDGLGSFSRFLGRHADNDPVIVAALTTAHGYVREVSAPAQTEREVRGALETARGRAPLAVPRQALEREFLDQCLRENLRKHRWQAIELWGIHDIVPALMALEPGEQTDYIQKFMAPEYSKKFREALTVRLAGRHEPAWNAALREIPFCARILRGLGH